MSPAVLDLTAQNPFFHRGPIRDPAYFFGRQQMIAQAISLIRNGQSVSIIGPRRIGKTSLLLRIADDATLLAHGIDPQRCCRVLVDCAGWGHDTPEAVFARLHDEISVAAGAGIPAGPPAMTYRDFERAVRAISAQGIRIIFLLDEFDTLCANAQLDADLFSGLRSLAMRYQVIYVTVSPQPLLALPGAGYGALSSPFFNFFAQLRLSLFDLAEATALLETLAARANRPFPNDAVAALLDLAGPHPFLLQIAAYHAFEAHAQSARAIADQAAARFLGDAEHHWLAFWRALAPNEQRALALLQVAGAAPAATIQRLIHAGLARRENNALVPLSPAFQAFIGHQAAPGLLQVPPITLDPQLRLALVNGQPVALSQIEFDLLVNLVEHQGEIVSHTELRQAVWGNSVTDETFKMTLRSLRRALGTAGACIRNTRGTGYAFIGE